MRLQYKTLLAWLFDYVLIAGLVSAFYYFTRFYDSIGQRNNAYLMELCAIITIFLLAIYIPWKYHVTLGEQLIHVQTLSNGKQLKLKQILIRDLLVRFVFGEFLLIFSLIYCIAMRFLNVNDSELPLDSFFHFQVISTNQHNPLPHGKS